MKKPVFCALAALIAASVCVASAGCGGKNGSVVEITVDGGGQNAHFNSTKSMIGHLLGAAGAAEFIACVKELEEGYLHATVGYQIPDEDCDLDYCKEPVEGAVTYALSNSLGFGGHNASLLIKKYEA